ncbi:hypothetical protein [Asanoa siamensis]|uniref:Uncharacterized protein n=1 Tax=Asanoa siamensis TaxID=926357 RepID=A0ABQ4CYK0_9ACTN|nr:hypothetical protein [Asanoa siamensis]GIF76381.1 hypothetical protein Asi02nite_58990 [Asanoa siamensis]
MGNEQTKVDILSLEDFRRALDARLTEAETLLRTVNGTAAARPPLGGFADAKRITDTHDTRQDAQVARVRRLIDAIRAARSATDTIISNYRTTEARNAANSADIADVLGGVQRALGGSSNG